MFFFLKILPRLTNGLKMRNYFFLSNNNVYIITNYQQYLALPMPILLWPEDYLQCHFVFNIRNFL